MAILQVIMGQPVAPDSFPSVVQRKPFILNSAGFQQGQISFLVPNQHRQRLKETQSTDNNQKKIPAGFIPS